MPNFIDLTGEKYGRLTVISQAENNNYRRVQWKCICDCGNYCIVSSNCLRAGHTKSCGCLATEERAKRAQKAGLARAMSLTKHGHCKERLYGIWKAMRQRCNNPKDKYYSDYGGRGITVCEEWNDYSIFREWAYIFGYDENAKFGECTLDRINNSLGYNPNNCRWVPLSVQANNRRERKDANHKRRSKNSN